MLQLQCLQQLFAPGLSLRESHQLRAQDSGGAREQGLQGRGVPPDLDQKPCNSVRLHNYQTILITSNN